MNNVHFAVYVNNKTIVNAIAVFMKEKTIVKFDDPSIEMISLNNCIDAEDFPDFIQRYFIKLGNKNIVSSFNYNGTSYKVAPKKSEVEKKEFTKVCVIRNEITLKSDQTISLTDIYGKDHIFKVIDFFEPKEIVEKEIKIHSINDKFIKDNASNDIFATAITHVLNYNKLEKSLVSKELVQEINEKINLIKEKPNFKNNIYFYFQDTKIKIQPEYIVSIIF